MRFYVLERRLFDRHDTYFSTEDSWNRGEPPTCPACGMDVGPYAWLPPYRVEIEIIGQELGDWVPGPGGSLLVSARFAEAFQHEGLSGLEGFDPVEVLRVKRARGGRVRVQAPAYLHVEIKRSSAALDDAASEVVRDEPIRCPLCRHQGLMTAKRIVLEQGSWGGEDIFKVRGLPGMEMASERFRQFCDAHGFPNIHLWPAENYNIDSSPEAAARRVGKTRSELEQKPRRVRSRRKTDGPGTA